MKNKFIYELCLGAKTLKTSSLEGDFSFEEYRCIGNNSNDIQCNGINVYYFYTYSIEKGKRCFKSSKQYIKKELAEKLVEIKCNESNEYIVRHFLLKFLQVDNRLFIHKAYKKEFDNLFEPHKAFVIKNTKYPYYFKLFGKIYESNTTNYYKWLSKNIDVVEPMLEEYTGKEILAKEKEIIIKEDCIGGNVSPNYEGITSSISNLRDNGIGVPGYIPLKETFSRWG